METYRRLEEIGDGTFAVVYRGECSKGSVALKRFRKGDNFRYDGGGTAWTALREIKILKELSHPNVMPVLDVLEERGKVTMVLPLCKWNLEEVIQRPETRLGVRDVKLYAMMLFRALAYVHAQGIIHRDIKANNILVGPENQVLLSDFGSATYIVGEEVSKGKLSRQVVTLWYRSPELLFGQPDYGASVDIWAAACVIGEMVRREPLFKGQSEIDQLAKIFQVLGTPTESDWPSMKALPFYMEFQRFDKVELSAFLHRDSCVLDQGGFDLLERLFQFDPSTRLSAQSALDDAWFQETPLPSEQLDPPRGEWNRQASPMSSWEGSPGQEFAEQPLSREEQQEEQEQGAREFGGRSLF